MLHEIVEGAIDKGNPDDVRAAYDSAFRALQPAIEQNGGIVLKLYKDKVIAGFGIPHVEEKAVRHARRMHKQLSFNWRDEELLRLAHKYDAEHKPFLVGAIHHGRNIFTGMLGTEQRRGYDLLGDDVNIAARTAAESMSTEDTDLRGPVRIIYSKEALEQDREVTLVTKRVTKFIPKGKTQEISGYVITSEEEKKAKTLIGRDKEVKQLEELVDGLFSDGKTRIVYISAPPGYGKTELTKVLIEQFKAKQGEVYTANSLEYAREVPDHVMQGLLRNILGLKEGQDKEQLTKIVNDKVKEDKRYIVNQWLSLGLDYAGPALSLAQLSEKRTETLAELLNTGKKTLVVLNDIHWADEESLLKWQKLTEKLQQNIVFATNYRTTDIPETYKPIVEKGLPINIAEFDSKGTAQLLERLINVVPEQKLVELAYTQSKGVPLYIEEVAAFLMQEQLVQNGRLTKDVSEIKLPGGIQDIILARYDKLKEEPLGAEARRYLEFASAMYGDEWSKDFLNIKNKDAVMKLLTERGFLKQNGTTGWHHNLTKKAIYTNIRPEVRKHQHEIIGRLIENRYKVNKDQNALSQHLLELAYHFENSTDLEKALNYNWMAEKRFVLDQQYNACVSYSGKIKKIFEAISTPSESQRNIYGLSLNGRGVALQNLRLLDDAEKAFLEAIEIAKGLSENDGDPLLLRIHTNLTKQYKDSRFKSHYRASLKLAKKLKDDYLYGSIKLNAGYLSKGAKKVKRITEALRRMQKYGDTTNLAMAHLSLAKSLIEQKEFDEARSVAENAFAMGERLKSIEMQGRGLFALAKISEQTDHEKAITYYEKSEEFLKRTEGPVVLSLYEAWSDLCIKLKRLDIAKEIIKKWQRACDSRERVEPEILESLEKKKKESGLSS
jgi:hypothetical protein